MAALVKLLPMFVIMIAVLGTIFAGVATPTEAAAIGATMVMVVALVYRRFTWPVLKESLINAVQTTCMLMFLVIGAMIFSHALTVLGVNREIPRLLLSVGNVHLAFGLIILFYLVMGMFIDGLSLLVMTIPIVYPAMIALGFDGIWFYVAYVIASEMGLLTPPVGLTLFVLQGMSGRSMADVAIGAFPYFLCQGVTLALVALLPSIALWLPSKMIG